MAKQVSSNILWLVVGLAVALIGLLLWFLIPGNVAYNSLKRDKEYADSVYSAKVDSLAKINTELNRDNLRLEGDEITRKKDQTSSEKKAVYNEKVTQNAKDHKSNMRRIHNSTRDAKARIYTELNDDPESYDGGPTSTDTPKSSTAVGSDPH